MTHYLIEVAIWILLIFMVGCLIGWLLRKWFGGGEATRVEPPAEPARPMEPVRPAPPVPPEPPAPVAVPGPAAAPVRMERPRGLEAARGGKPDNLQRISGIGPKNEKILHTLGFFHFDQIASWTPQQVSWVDDHLKFNGRIGREEWIEQSRLLASGAEDEFVARYGPKKNRPA